MQIMRFSTDTSFFGYAALLVFLACPLSVLGQTDLTPYQSNCQNGTTGVIELPNNSGFIMAVTDSTFVRYPEGSIGLVPGALRMNAPLAEFYHEYILDNTLYLVHGGGGVVLAYDGQNFDRIDRSFLHQNQYLGTPFVYQGSLYLFGGAGLFSSKDFVTRYDFEAREWYLQKTQGSIPALGFNHIYQGLIVGESFYTSSSANTDASQEDKATQWGKNAAYRLDLKTWTWHYLGGLTPVPLAGNKGIPELQNNIGFQSQGKYYYQSQEGLVCLDFVNNILRIYKDQKLQYSSVKSDLIGYSASGNLLLSYCDSADRFNIVAVSEATLADHLIYEDSFYQEDINAFYSTIISLLALILFIALVVVLLTQLRSEGRLVIRIKQALFIYKGKRIVVFSEPERDLLITLALEGKMSLPAIEDLVSDAIDSSAVRIKKRERLIKSLNDKIGALFNESPKYRSEYFLFDADTEDRRIRVVALNLQHFKVL